MMIKNFMDRLYSVVNLVSPLPLVVLELLKALMDPDVGLNTLSRIISTDPSMSINVLKVANSAYYKLPHQVKTIDHAVRILGAKQITTICVACGVYDVLTPRQTPHDFDYNAFWKHSVATGVIARRLAQELHMGNRAIIYLCGLLHDIGKIILHRIDHDAYAAAVSAAAESAMSILEAERLMLGESHDVVGSLIMEEWDLPGEITSVVRYHHFPMSTPEGRDRHFVAFEHLSDRLAAIRYAFYSEAPESLPVSEEVFNILVRGNPYLAELDLEDFAWARQDTDKEINEMQAMLMGHYSGN
jgi:putative nucleotidyltransferase with HDIG domain